jgi:hypothetical protein
MKKPAISTLSFRRALTIRERFLLALLLIGVGFTALILFFKDYHAAGANLALLHAKAEMRQLELEKKDDITARLAGHIERMKSVESLQLATLQEVVERNARQARLIPNTIVPSNKTDNGIQVLSVRLTFTDATMERLLLFEDRLRAQKIPLSLVSAVLDPTPRDGELRASYEIAVHRLAAQNDTTARRTSSNNNRASSFASAKK